MIIPGVIRLPCPAFRLHPMKSTHHLPLAPADVASLTHSQCQAYSALQALANPDKAAFLAGYFKTGPGQYGEGDRFLGVVVPAVRQLARRFKPLGLAEVERLLDSPFNEARLLALLIWLAQCERGDEPLRAQIYARYLARRDRVNNWNLVDTSAPAIVGGHLLTRDRSVLDELAHSSVLWDRRIAVLATFAFVRAADFADPLRLCTLLLGDPHDLIHKACGWMLREVGIRDMAVLAGFVRSHQTQMPRTMLRYAIERFAPEQRRAAMAGRF